MKKNSKISGGPIFNLINNTFLIFCFLIVFYPLLYIVVSSFSSPEAVIAGKVWLYPVEPTFRAYTTIFKDSAIVTGYLNSLFYTVSGTIINVIITIMAAYPLSRKDLAGKNIIMFLFTFTMFFSGGMIPTYLVVKDLKLINTVWAMLIPSALSVWNVIITKTFFQTNIPNELLESAQIDGCTNMKFILKIVLPLSAPIIAVITLFYGVGNWNAYFNALLYLKSSSLYPLQIVLRNILILNQVDPKMFSGLSLEAQQSKQYISILLKFALVVVSSLPVLIAYPFVQKHFVKGIMLGSIKG